MADFSSGVKAYITGEYTVKVNFPVDLKDNAEVFCLHCPYLSSNERFCQLNKELTAFPKKFIGDKCPLKFKAGEENV